MSYQNRGFVPEIEPIADPWYRSKAQQLRRVAASSRLGQTDPSGMPLLESSQESAAAPSDALPPPVAAPKYAYMIGWGGIILITAGLFWGASRGVGTGAVSPNRRRRRTSRRSRRRSSRRRGPRRLSSNRLKRYKALSASARKRMPDKDFALPGRRFPIAGPPGSSRERDKWQAMQAIRYLNMGRIGSKQDYLAVRNAVIRRYGMNFWRSYDGPSWDKVMKAKRKRGASRRRRTSRRMAANPKRPRRDLNQSVWWGYDRYLRRWFVEAPNGNVRFFGNKRKADDTSRGLADRYGMYRRRDDRRPERFFRERFGMSRSEHARKHG